MTQEMGIWALVPPLNCRLTKFIKQMNLQWSRSFSFFPTSLLRHKTHMMMIDSYNMHGCIVRRYTLYAYVAWIWMQTCVKMNEWMHFIIISIKCGWVRGERKRKLKKENSKMRKQPWSKNVVVVVRRVTQRVGFSFLSLFFYSFLFQEAFFGKVYISMI